MRQQFLAWLNTAFRYWRNDYLSVRVASVYIVLLAVVFYIFGSIRTTSDYRTLKEELTTARKDMRLFASAMTRQNDELSLLRAKNDLQEKTITLLNTRIEEINAHNIKIREQSALYQQIFSDNAPNQNVTIYDLKINHGFAPHNWNIGAILVRFGRHKKNYTGGYHLEVLYSDNDDEQILRFPAEDNFPLDMAFSHEVEKTITLPPNANIRNVRLIVVDEENVVITSAELEKPKDSNRSNGDNSPSSTQ